MAFKVGSVKSGPKTVGTPPARPSFVLGSRPPDLRAPRIKPMTGQTQYGKTSGISPRSFNAGGAGFGNTAQTDMS